MSIVVTDAGFAADDFHPLAPDAPLAPRALIGLERFLAETPEALAAAAPLGVAVPNDLQPELLARRLGEIALISVRFPSFADGRGFSVARRLRALGFTGRLRAEGHVIVDQYAYARACGFDEAAIDDALAARQPEAQWLSAAGRAAAPSYRAKLRLRAA